MSSLLIINNGNVSIMLQILIHNPIVDTGKDVGDDYQKRGGIGWGSGQGRGNSSY